MCKRERERERASNRQRNIYVRWFNRKCKASLEERLAISVVLRSFQLCWLFNYFKIWSVTCSTKIEHEIGAEAQRLWKVHWSFNNSSFFFSLSIWCVCTIKREQERARERESERTAEKDECDLVSALTKTSALDVKVYSRRTNNNSLEIRWIPCLFFFTRFDFVPFNTRKKCSHKHPNKYHFI